MPGPGSPGLPLTVLSGHLASCAGDLVEGIGTGRPAAGELATALTDLVGAQRQIAAALAGLAENLRDQHAAGGMAAMPSPDLTALTEILSAAACASGCASQALAETAPMMAVLVESTRGDAAP